MADTTRPLDVKIANAIEQMRKMYEAAKGMREAQEPQTQQRPTVERQSVNR